MVLTISPLFSLCEAMLGWRDLGIGKSPAHMLRVRIVGATCLKRPVVEGVAGPMHDTPSPFAVITVDGKDIYHTLAQVETRDPQWNESFDTEMSEVSTIFIRVFDASVTYQGQPVLLGYTSTTLFSMIYSGRRVEGRTSTSLAPAPGLGMETNDLMDNAVVLQALPLALNRRPARGASITLSASTDVSSQPSPFVIPPHGRRVGTTVRMGTTLYGWGGKGYVGYREETRTDTYRMEQYASVARHTSETG